MGGTTVVAAVALAALGCQRLAGLAVELAVELAVALGARSLLYVVGVVTVIWNHLHCDCGNVVSIDAFATVRWDHLKNLHCLMQMFFRHRLDCERRGLALASSSREHSWIWRHRYRHSSAAPLQLRQRLDARLLRSSSYNSRTATSQTWQRHVLQLCQCLHIFCCRQLRQQLEQLSRERFCCCLA